MLDNKDAALAAYAIYKCLEEKQIKFTNHGTFDSVAVTRNGVEGFWIFTEEEPFFLPKEVLEGLTAAPEGITPAKVVRLHDVFPDAPAFPAAPVAAAPAGNKSLTWDTPEIQRRLLDIVAEAQAADTRYIRVISKTKTGKQETRARIEQGTSPENVMKIIMNVRRRSKDPTVMAEVLNVRLKRTLARSFPLELAGA